jgi:hypothetical protein
MSEATSPIPAPRAEDPEEVARDLESAGAAWRAGEPVEALAALRRAASSAYRLHTGRRVSELAKAVSELSKTVIATAGSAPKAAPAPAPAPAPAAATSGATSEDDIAISLDDDVSDASAAKRPPPPPSPKKPSKRPPGRKSTPPNASTRTATMLGVPKNPAPSAVTAKPAITANSVPGAAVTAASSASATMAAAMTAAADSASSAAVPVAAPMPAPAVAVAATTAEPPASSKNGEAKKNPALGNKPTTHGVDEEDMPRPVVDPPTTKDHEPDAMTPAPSVRTKEAHERPTKAPTMRPPDVSIGELEDVPGLALLSSLDPLSRAGFLAGARAIELAAGAKADAPDLLVVVRGAIDVVVPERSMAVDTISTPELVRVKPIAPATLEGGKLEIVAKKDGARVIALGMSSLDGVVPDSSLVRKQFAKRCDAMHVYAAVMRARPIATLTDTQLQELRKRSEPRRLTRGQVVVNAGEAVRALVIVAAGALTMRSASPRKIGPGEVLAPKELLDNAPSPAEVEATEDVLILAARLAATSELFRDHPVLRDAIKTWGVDDPFQEW